MNFYYQPQLPTQELQLSLMTNSEVTNLDQLDLMTSIPRSNAKLLFSFHTSPSGAVQPDIWIDPTTTQSNSNLLETSSEKEVIA